MSNFFCTLFDCVKKRKGYFLFLIFLSLLTIVLGIIAAINFGGEILSIDLTNIAYIRFLQGGGFVGMCFGLFLSLFVFFAVILICHIKPFLVPLAVLFYLYLVYSQTVIILSIILIYGILNCIILVLLLIIYSLIIWFLFMLLLCELIDLTNKAEFFKTCFSCSQSKVIWYLLLSALITLVFALILIILKNYVILLVY